MIEPRGGEPVRFGDALKAAVERRRWTARLKGSQVFERWDDIAGPHVAANVQPVRLAGGVLVLSASSAAWATEAGYLSTELMRRANELLGEAMVTRVQITVGRGSGGTRP